MSGSTVKKVLLERFDRTLLKGFVNPASYLQPEGAELLSPEGNVTTIPYNQIKAISFVRDLEGLPIFGERREFLSRPKASGLWLALTFRDQTRMEGMLANELLQLDGVGYTVSPPEVTGNTQRVFVPRPALESVVVLGVVGSALRKRKGDTPAELRQIRLFSEEESSADRTR